LRAATRLRTMVVTGPSRSTCSVIVRLPFSASWHRPPTGR
jgi:hypothetical protein